MKNIFTLILFIHFFILNNLLSQEIQNLVPRLDFAIPDAPAFTIVNVSESNILRPATVNDLTLSISNIISDLRIGVGIPQSYCLEFSPGFLYNGQSLTNEVYSKYDWFYRTRLSFGIKANNIEKNNYSAGVGIRFSIFDKQDLRLDEDYKNKSAEITSRSIKKIKDKLNSLITQYCEEKHTIINEIVKDSLLMDSLETEAKEMVERQANQAISEIRKDWAEKNWNADILEFAFATRIAAPDTLTNIYGIDKYTFWLTYGKSIFSFGQLLIGVNGQVQRDSISSNFVGNIKPAFRFYIGSNHLKVFFEAQSSHTINKIPEYLLNFGLELKIYPNIWLVLNYGTQKTNISNEWKEIYNIKIELPFFATSIFNN
ncbi:MAG: hypothetical protein EPN82_06005 [Bacteroidetes bacterium]|nr:MAG: hypothetical protein EPN82_06005 [Bacteroidota bacterium]